MSMSRLSQARQAVRPALKARLMLSGPPGSGKTRTALIVARQLAEGADILVIDTEKESALTYADDFDFVHLPWEPPFDPRELTVALREACGHYGVIVIDSLTHFWKGEGGTLDVAAGKFTGWKEARPIQEALVDGILKCQSHIILGVRSKVEHVQEIENGRHVVKKLGMADQQDSDLAFEMNVAFELDSMSHAATATKSRTTVIPVGRAYEINRTVEMADTYRDWLKGGEPPAPVAFTSALVDRMNALPETVRNLAKHEFVGSFGKPPQLRESRMADAEALVARYEAEQQTSPPDVGKETGTVVDHDVAGSGSEPGPGDPAHPFVAPAADLKPIGGAEAKRLHALAHRKPGADDAPGEQALDGDTFRILTWAASCRRTDSSSSLTLVESDTLRQAILAARAGRYDPTWPEISAEWLAWDGNREAVAV